MKKLVALLMAVVMVLGMFGMVACDSKTENTDTDKTIVDEIKEAGKLVLYTEAGFAPYEFVSDNEVVGVDIEIMKAVAEELGVELEINDVNFDTIISAVQSGKADVGAAGITITDARKENVDFSVPYSSTEQYVIVFTENDIPTAEDLAGKVIGVQQGTTSDMVLEKLINDGTMEGAEVQGYTAPAVAAASLNKMDAVVTDKLTAQIIVNSSEGKMKADKFLKADGTAVADVEEYGVAVSKENGALLEVINTVLNKLLEEGKVDAWVEQYNALALEIGA